jgi:predicted DNA-binding antitoxin AbrB/MazE fold protein
MKTIHAIYENGVFRPTEPVNLPERSHVEFEPRQVALLPCSTEAAKQVVPTPAPEALDRIYDILSERYDGGETDVAARHNEHQP